jgi:hypothetical protein
VYVYDECHRIELSEQQLQTLRDSRWIAVEERWPKHGSDVLAGIDLASQMDGDSWMLSDGRLGKPTHWMPLPEPPAKCP